MCALTYVSNVVILWAHIKITLCQFSQGGDNLIYSSCAIDPFTGREGRQDYVKIKRLVKDLSQAAIILKVNLY